MKIPNLQKETTKQISPNRAEIFLAKYCNEVLLVKFGLIVLALLCVANGILFIAFMGGLDRFFFFQVLQLNAAIAFSVVGLPLLVCMLAASISLILRFQWYLLGMVGVCVALLLIDVPLVLWLIYQDRLETVMPEDYEDMQGIYLLVTAAMLAFSWSLYRGEDE